MMLGRETNWDSQRREKSRKTPHLPVRAAGEDLVDVWVVAHSPKQSGGDHHSQTHKTPAGGEESEKDKW